MVKLGPGLPTFLLASVAIRAQRSVMHLIQEKGACREITAARSVHRSLCPTMPAYPRICMLALALAAGPAARGEIPEATPSTFAETYLAWFNGVSISEDSGHVLNTSGVPGPSGSAYIASQAADSISSGYSELGLN